ncbi:MAG: putative toxin-antitoxin system toxin component, PIN family [Thermomicrobiales bacterium]
MRIIADVNVLISRLLQPHRLTAVNITVHSVLSGDVELLIPPQVIRELASAVTNSPYLAGRITAEHVDTLLAALAPSATILPDLADDLSLKTRDSKDNYLLAYTVVFRPDYLVSGDKDLLTLNTVDGIPILSPARFVQVLRELGIIEPDQNGERS